MSFDYMGFLMDQDLEQDKLDFIEWVKEEKQINPGVKLLDYLHFPGIFLKVIKE